MLRAVERWQILFSATLKSSAAHCFFCSCLILEGGIFPQHHKDLEKSKDLPDPIQVIKGRGHPAIFHTYGLRPVKVKES